MKSILLQFKHDPDSMKWSYISRPRRYVVDAEQDNVLFVSHVQKFRDGSKVTERYTLTRQPDGSYRNQFGCEFVVAKIDRRPKPYSVTYVSGIGEGTNVNKFATIEDVREYVKGRWQGEDYVDGVACFHNDFGHFYLNGCTLNDLGY